MTTGGAGLTLAVVVGVAGCSSPPAPTRSLGVDSVRSDADGRGLVATYRSGACDGPTRLGVQESPEEVVVDVLVEPTDAEICPAIELSLFVHTRLAAPLDGRVVITDAGGRKVPVFDGARLLVPERRRQGHVVVSEQAEVAGSSVVAWSQGWGPPGSGDFGAVCDGGSPPTLTVRVGTADPWTGWQEPHVVPTASSGAATGRTYLTGPPSAPLLTGRSIELTRAGKVVSVASQSRCGGGGVLSEPDLVAVTDSLRPAG